MCGDLRFRSRGLRDERLRRTIPLAGKGIRTIELPLMSPDTRHDVDRWWSDLFGVPVSMLWRETVTVGMHAGLGDYPGVFVAERHGSVPLSLPDWVTPDQVRLLESQDASALLSRDFWATWRGGDDVVVLGPAVHAFTDSEPDLGDQQPEVVLLTVDDLSTLRAAVTDEDWEESGFAHAEGTVHAVLQDDEVVAAAHLAGFLGGAADVNVLVAPDGRGRGLGRSIGGAATRSAVRQQGIARWRSRVDNAPSRALSAALGFEDYCRQLAVRPTEE
jgi:hypothetical protein